MRGALLAVVLAGCALDPDEELAAAALQVRIEGIDTAASAVVARIYDDGGALLDAREAGAEPPAMTLYFLETPAAVWRLRVESRDAAGLLQCFEHTVEAGQRQVDAVLGAGCDAGEAPAPDAGPRDGEDAGRGRPPSPECPEERGRSDDRDLPPGPPAKPERPEDSCGN